MRQKLNGGKRQTLSRDSQGTQAKMGSRSLGKIQSSTAFVRRDRRVLWEEAKILETEKNPVYRKCKEAAYVACLQNTVSRPSVEISPIWYPLTRNELS
jgi:hypothetical protein